MAPLAAQMGAIKDKLKDIVQLSPKAEEAPPAFESFPGAPPSFLDLQGSMSNVSYDESDLHAQATSPVSAGGGRMGIFVRRYQEAWHTELLNSGADQCLFGGQPFASFPFGTLSSATDVFITKRKLIPDTQFCDARLVDMVLEHSRRDGAVKDVAILACLHALSYSAGSNLLASLREECSSSGTDERFLRCLVLAHYANPSLIRASECHSAKYLLQLLAGYDYLEKIPRLFQSLMEDTGNPTVLSASYINSILRTLSFQTSFQSHLNTLQSQHRYKSLFDAVSWLGPIAALPDASTARAVISTILPRWREWTSWRPNYFRLTQWEEEGNFTNDQKQRLHPIFELEGPDPTEGGRSTFKDSPACFRSIRTRSEDRVLIDQLLSLLDAVLPVPGTHAAEFFIFMCVENRNPIDHHLLSLVQAILDTKDNDCIRAMQLWFSSLSDSSGFNNRMVALTRILPTLGSHEALQRMVGDDLITDVVDIMCSARAELAKMLAAEVPDNLAMKIHAFGTTIRGTEWLQPKLTPVFLRELQLLPSQETMIEVLDSVQRPHAPVELVRRYLSVVICGKEGDDAALLASIQGNISFWSESLDPEKAALAVALENISYIDAEVQNACRHRIREEDLFLVRDLLPLVRADTNNSCVAFARILRNMMPLQNREHDCWLSLLLSLLLDRQDDILVWSAQELPVEEWFSWIEDLRILFPHRDGEISVTDLGFDPSKYEWWDLLASRYRHAIHQLELMHRRRGNLRWLWFQEFADIPALLEVLSLPPERHSPVERFILGQLQPMPDKIRLVCESLNSLGCATAAGRVAFESVFSRFHENHWSQEAMQALVGSWSYSSELSTGDRQGLLALSELLGLQASVDGDSIARAQQSLSAHHETVIAMARDLEDLRVRLMSEQSGSSRLLEALGVENGRPGSDPSIPESLSGAVERIGERQWELCFPLAHLNTQTRQVLGVDESSRLLLVRISFMRQQPSFCIHFYPSNEEMDRNHGPWYVEDEMPDGRVCWTNPSPLVYLLSRSLHDLLSRGSRDLAAIYQLVKTTLRDPAARCIVCARNMSCKLWRPTVCSNACSEDFQRAPIEVRVASLVSDPLALDLLLTCVYSAAGDGTMTLDLLPDCPFTKERVRQVIDAFPSLPVNARPHEILSQIRVGTAGQPTNLLDDDNHQISDGELLLSWMSIQFRGCLVSAPQDSRVPSMPGVLQLLMPNSSPARETAFENCFASANPSDAARGGVGGVTFHGAAVERLWRGLTEGLKATIHGRPGLQVQGVALADEADLVLGSCGDTSSGGWARSAIQNKNVMLVCELAGHAWQTYHTISEENRIAVRYVLLCPKGFTPPRTSQISEELRRSFQALKRGVDELDP